MGQFSISDLENLSGIKAHTIRIWEQRYGILRPERTPTNIRLYRDDDLRRLLNVATLCGQGHRISKVARLSDQEIAAAVISCSDDAHDYARQVNSLLAAMLELDEPRLYQLLSEAVRQLGFEAAILHVAYPFLQRIGILWQTGSVNPAQEHLVANILRQKMLAATDALPPVAPAAARRWVLFLPEGEMHELALLFMNHALRARGHHVLYLGQNLPAAELAAVCRAYQPYAVCTVLTAVPERDQVQDFVNQLARNCPDVALILYGPLVQAQTSLTLPPKAIRPALMTEFLALADQLDARSNQ
ncbi:DNA-binding transcriptional regulator, MerR family [Hymenobacter daecheongensis DSM 21074]|uniref:DNA-binding transcriptional regulator, MerR family n=1 Tax=Hymenobacter daecheongensis DSM 21074 TaxID=1121955 RepID=A0A1M6G1Y3_9BACT|nr:MerR family transcriptional regulator [Hymenobacter daecheongensis]SHJ03930.1 DNA-binding transcriptional regulator, MerR family [Hymenobacter daecheongensis DSM 21074]